eukprot:s4020_g1.t1
MEPFKGTLILPLSLAFGLKSSCIRHFCASLQQVDQQWRKRRGRKLSSPRTL